jgi:hypothetical protein
VTSRPGYAGHAVSDRIVHGLTETEAAQAAITEFGPPDAVADAFRGELATAYARRTIALFVVTGPLVGIWWLLLLQPHPWRTGVIALIVAIPVIPLLPIAVATNPLNLFLCHWPPAGWKIKLQPRCGRA